SCVATTKPSPWSAVRRRLSPRSASMRVDVQPTAMATMRTARNFTCACIYTARATRGGEDSARLVDGTATNRDGTATNRDRTPTDAVVLRGVTNIRLSSVRVSDGASLNPAHRLRVTGEVRALVVVVAACQSSPAAAPPPPPPPRPPPPPPADA